MRCVCVTPNASVDTTYWIDRLARGGVIRVSDRQAVAGGKGNNVARVLCDLGHDMVATGFVAGSAGRFIEHALDECGVEPRFVQVPGESRTCLSILEADVSVVTELRESGPRVGIGAADKLVDRVAELAADADAVVLSGSLPTTEVQDLYRRIIREVRRTSAFVALDSSGDSLLDGIAAGPDLVKPNWEEMVLLAGSSDIDLDAAVEFVQQRLLAGPLPPGASVLLSLGKDGAVLIDAGAAIQLSVSVADPVNPVGAGDAMLAGYLDAWARGARGEEVLRWASGVAAASLGCPAPGQIDAARIEHFAGEACPVVQLSKHHQ